MSTAVAKRTALVADRQANISVSFRLVTPDRLKRIDFTLTRLPVAGNFSWTVTFEVGARSNGTGEFECLLHLHANIDRNENYNAAATAANGLNFNQLAQVLIAADSAIEANTGNETALAAAHREALAVVSLRNS